MKQILASLIIIFLGNFSVSAQYIKLIPEKRYDPVKNVVTPDYEGAIELLNTAVNKYADNICQKEVGKQLEAKILAASKQVSVQTTYTGVVDYTSKRECSITSFGPLKPGEKPAVIHHPHSKISVFTIEVYPFADISKKKVFIGACTKKEVISDQGNYCKYFENNTGLLYTSGESYNEVRIKLQEMAGNDKISVMIIQQGTHFYMMRVKSIASCTTGCSRIEYYFGIGSSQESAKSMAEKNFELFSCPSKAQILERWEKVY